MWIAHGKLPPLSRESSKPSWTLGLQRVTCNASLAWHYFEQRPSSVDRPNTHRRVDQEKKMAMSRSHIKEGWQFYCLLRHAFEPTLPSWATSWSPLHLAWNTREIIKKNWGPHNLHLRPVDFSPRAQIFSLNFHSGLGFSLISLIWINLSFQPYLKV